MLWHRLSAVKSTRDDSGMKLQTEGSLGSKKWPSGWGCYWQIERKVFFALSTGTESDPKVTIPRLFIGRRLKTSLARPGEIVTRKGSNLTKVKSSFFSCVERFVIYACLRLTLQLIFLGYFTQSKRHFQINFDVRDGKINNASMT